MHATKAALSTRQQLLHRATEVALQVRCPVLYTIERVNWCIRRGCDVLFRLTFRRVWLEERKLWADQLVFAEELYEFESPKAA